MIAWIDHCYKLLKNKKMICLQGHWYNFNFLFHVYACENFINGRVIIFCMLITLGYCFKCLLTNKDSSVVHLLIILSIIVFIFNSGDDGRKFVSFVLLSILNVRVKKNINAWLFKCNANSGKPRQGVKTYGESYSNREIRPNAFF